MKKLLVATHNPSKLNELRFLLSDLPLELVSLVDLNIKEEVQEDGTTYLENSQKKALAYSQKSGLPALADDGGIEIVALNYAPGIHSKRWLGEAVSEEALIKHLYTVSQQLPDNNRDAYFKTVISLALPNGFVWSGKGEIKGIIAKEPYVKILPGFPYRSFFFLPELNKYFFENELTSEEMELHNHRHKAIAKLRPIIQKKLSL